MVLKRILLALFLTTFVFTIVHVIDRVLNPPAPIYATPFNTFSFILTVGSIFTMILIGIPNVLLLLLLYYTKIGKDFLSNVKFLILEVCLLWLCFQVVEKIIKHIEYMPKVEIFSKDGGRKFYFTDTFQFICAFVMLFFLLMVIKKIFIGPKKGVFSDSE